MKAAFGLVAVAMLSVLGVLALSDATKFEGETEDDGSTRVVFEVDVKNYHHPLSEAAASLWYACVSVVNWEGATPPERVDGQNSDSDGGEFVATVRPALGEDSSRRFRGCLEDATVDKVSGDVERMETIDP